MHACGHDVHITSMLGTAKVLSEMKDQWQGTLIILGQPAEETVDGARAMMRDGLYQKFPKPDYVVALHDNSDLEAGKVGYTAGYSFASADSVDIKIRGVGGHGAAPEKTKDPIVVAAEIILALQTIVSRENSPLDPAVIAVGSIHGDSKRNIIPDEVNLQVTVRAYREEVRQRMLASIERIAKGIALAAGIPADRAPIVKVSDVQFTSATYNDPALTERLVGAFTKALGAENVVKLPPLMVSEDFGHLSMDKKIPSVDFSLGAVDPEKVKQSLAGGPALPSLHSALFAPLPEPTLRTGVKAMTVASPRADEALSAKDKRAARRQKQKTRRPKGKGHRFVALRPLPRYGYGMGRKFCLASDVDVKVGSGGRQICSFAWQKMLRSFLSPASQRYHSCRAGNAAPEKLAELVEQEGMIPAPSRPLSLDSLERFDALPELSRRHYLKRFMELWRSQ